MSFDILEGLKIGLLIVYHCNKHITPIGTSSSLSETQASTDLSPNLSNRRILTPAFSRPLKLNLFEMI